MGNHDDIERLFFDTPKPNVIEGPHRLYLKQSLVQQMQKEGIQMSIWKKKLVLACCMVMIMVISGWAANKIYKSFTVKEEVVTEEVTTSDGNKAIYTHSKAVMMSSDDPEYTEEKAKAQYEEIQQLMKEGKYEFIGLKETKVGKIYTYRFTLSNGEKVGWGSAEPLHLKEKKGYSYQEAVDFIKQGRAKLIEVKKSDSGADVYIYRIVPPDGQSFTFGSDVPLETKD